MIYLVLSLFFSLFLHAQGSIAIFTGTADDGAPRPWDPDKIKTGITGSEEAVIYMSNELAKLGYQVTVFALIPPNSPYFAPTVNPRFVPLDYQENTHFDIGIGWRLEGSAKAMKKRASKAYLWPHDSSATHLAKEDIEAFDGVFWISEFQRNAWIAVNPSFSRFREIFGNGILPDQFPEVQERTNPYSCIYISSYDRGLKVLLDAWPRVKKEFPKATLDIYYGWQRSGITSVIEEAKMAAHIQSLAFLGVEEHGLVGHEELNAVCAKASLWTYPLISKEAFCISALRAQFAGAVPVIIDGSALKETVRHGYKCNTKEEYLSTLLNAMRKAEEISLEERRKQRQFILEKYTWPLIASQWKKLFDATAF